MVTTPEKTEGAVAPGVLAEALIIIMAVVVARALRIMGGAGAPVAVVSP